METYRWKVRCCKPGRIGGGRVLQEQIKLFKDEEGPREQRGETASVLLRYRQIPRDDDEDVSSKELRDLLNKIVRKVDALKERSK